jgi:hypothetical protein
MSETSRYSQYTTDVSALTLVEFNDSMRLETYTQWINAYANWVYTGTYNDPFGSGGDRPPHKPPTA